MLPLRGLLRRPALFTEPTENMPRDAGLELEISVLPALAVHSHPSGAAITFIAVRTQFSNTLALS